ncbi:hypothetical protein DRJ04_09600 [Candidatus Aerophobetes bacterium]|uniref:Uncharacterized protein n=1 Tax=Aerophobetes bacterium TaxID=2030807 RepID=A0A662D8S5_UNCAE|nr:MAG: hypothetical protein DRJ04_09600 [Candidatus Aerophobetes bacterium]
MRNHKEAYELEGRFPVLETEIDEFLKFIQERKSITLMQAMKKFNVKRETIEEWGKILEENGIIEVHYPVVGQPVFKIKGLKERVRKGGVKKKKVKIKMTPKRIIINIELAVLSLLLIYIFLVNKKLSQNFLPTVIFYLWVIFSDPKICMLVLVLPLIPVCTLYLIRHRKHLKSIFRRLKRKHKNQKRKLKK